MAERYFGAFLQGMRELGYVEGQNSTFESRFLDGDCSRTTACGRAASSQA
jgi:hypothetical protein